MHVVLLSLQEADSSNLLYEERLERAEQRRLVGNSLFAEGRFREALGKYAVVGGGGGDGAVVVVLSVTKCVTV
jgi:hypothetical protein